MYNLVLRDFGGYFDLENKVKEKQKLQEEASSPNFWDDTKRARKVSKRLTFLENIIKKFHDLKDRYDDLEELAMLAEDDEDMQAELQEMVPALKKEVEHIELENMLSGEDDDKNAILSIHPGAGGTESQDWAEILLRMYTRWMDKNDYEYKELNFMKGEEAGIKDVTLQVKGEYAYGYLKAEAGIHRLVRISPFDSNQRRHTSFASVFVYPEIDDTIEVDIDENDLRIDTYRASGAGGQHVNKTESAIRIIHEPTGIKVQCQNERSQHKNKDTAMKLLKARLYQKKKEEREKERNKMENNKKDIAWGNQIRSYVFHPYRKVKDHRTNLEEGNVDAVMDGDIDKFIKTFLLQNQNNKE
ncbi:MAG: peptide chain release factor 2 [Candidatus Marinimicrobia bacterium]|nr:peptide chain release factor 2 [Candidatus Neomarinimicrobiota bacterium]